MKPEEINNIDDAGKFFADKVSVEALAEYETELNQLFVRLWEIGYESGCKAQALDIAGRLGLMSALNGDR